MYTILTSVGDETSIVPAESSPNDVAPDPGRIFTVASGSDPCRIFSLGCSDSTFGEDYAYFTVWGRVSEFTKWFIVADVIVVNGFYLDLDGQGTPYFLPRGMEFTTQVFINAGATGCTKLAIGTY